MKGKVRTMKVVFISPGCDKNLVDSEYLLGILTQAGQAMLTQANQSTQGVLSLLQ